MVAPVWFRLPLTSTFTWSTTPAGGVQKVVPLSGMSTGAAAVPWFAGIGPQLAVAITFGPVAILAKFTEPSASLELVTALFLILAVVTAFFLILPAVTEFAF